MTGFQSIATNTTSVQRDNDMCGEREKKKGRGRKGKERRNEWERGERIFKIKVENDVKEEDEASGGAAATEAREISGCSRRVCTYRL